MVEAAVLSRREDAATAESRPLRLLVLTLKREGVSPGQRFRIEQWAPHLEANHDIAVDYLPFESPRLSELLYQPGHVPEKAVLAAWDFLRRAAAVVRAKSYDAVIVFREAALLGPAIYERLLVWTGTPIFFDYDDAIWHPTHSASASGVFARLHFFGKAATICRLSSAVFPGNSYLADYARRYNDNVVIMPTTIELADYPVLPEPEADTPFIVGWTGSNSTLAHFDHARTALERLAERLPLRVKVICNKAPDVPIAGADNEFVLWSSKDEAKEVADCHVGIMPLPDDDFTRGKCGLKALQFMATGRPVVISPVGMNRDLVEDGENGFLAGTVDEWVEALERLAASPELRRSIGAAGRRTVEQGYSAEVIAARLAGAIRASLPAKP
jgi:glycosyltransferase involved in cell wall biosynthesis